VAVAKWRPPATRGILSLSTLKATASRKENACGQAYRTGCAQGNLHDGDPGAERQEARAARGGDPRRAAGGPAQDHPETEHLCFEEGTQAAWLYETLSLHVDETVVTVKRERRGHKDDQRDAFDLADKLRPNSLEVRVYKDVGRYGRLRELSRVDRMQVRDSVRVQNRVLALYRSRGTDTDDSLYKPDQRQAWIGKLPDRMHPPYGGEQCRLHVNWDAEQCLISRSELRRCTRGESPASRTPASQASLDRLPRHEPTAVRCNPLAPNGGICLDAPPMEASANVVLRKTRRHEFT
jgi:hypothetical protein